MPPFPCWCLDRYPKPWSLAVVSGSAVVVVVVAIVAIVAIIAVVAVVAVIAIRLLCL